VGIFSSFAYVDHEWALEEMINCNNCSCIIFQYLMYYIFMNIYIRFIQKFVPLQEEDIVWLIFDDNLLIYLKTVEHG
jgi:hypothetical protein